MTSPKVNPSDLHWIREGSRQHQATWQEIADANDPDITAEIAEGLTRNGEWRDGGGTAPVSCIWPVETASEGGAK